MQGSKEPVKYPQAVLDKIKKVPKHLTAEFLNECAEMIPKDNSPVLVKPQQEVFLRFFILNQATRGNVTQSYALSINEDLSILSKENITRPVIKNGKPVIKNGAPVMEEIKNSSPYNKRQNVCNALGSKWLTYPKVNARRMQITSELLKDHVIDNEMLKVITQDGDLTAKNTAIREYNKLKQRIVDRKDIRTQSVGVMRHLYDNADAFDYDAEEDDQT